MKTCLSKELGTKTCSASKITPKATQCQILKDQFLAPFISIVPFSTEDWETHHGSPDEASDGFHILYISSSSTHNVVMSQ